MLACEQQHVDHLGGGLRGPVALGQLRPQLVEAARPLSSQTLVVQRDGPGERARLVDQQVEIVLQLRRDTEPARETIVRSDRIAVVGDHDHPRADLRVHAQPDQADRDRVAVLTNGHHRLRVNAWARLLAGLRALSRQRSKQRPLARERLTDRARMPDDPPREIGLAAREQPGVQLGKALDARDWDEVASAKPSDLALDAALLMRSLQADPRELRLEQVVRAQRDEPIALHATAALQDLLHRRAQIVVAHQCRHAAEELERVGVALQERLLRLAPKRRRERRARVTEPQLEQVDLHELPVDHRPRLAPIDLALHAGLVMLRHERLTDIAQLTPARTHVPADLTLRHDRALLLNQALPDPPRGMPLLARRIPISLKPRIDQRAIRPELRRRPRHRRPLQRRYRRLERLPHRPPMNTMPGR